ncbi:MAG: D-alanyl-D-alanine carboxypeptidase, partial [Clostridiales bacterium]|nr:D-alanyl-D-alanine carboxypeptidase [Clostridiales bacterium]
YETKYCSLENDMTIGGMTAQNSISLLLAPEGRIILPEGAEFKDAESALTFELPDPCPKDAVALIRYTYNSREVGAVYLYSEASDLKSTAPSATSYQATGLQPDSDAQTDGASQKSPPSKAPTKPDIVSKEGTASSIRIPVNAWTMAGIALSLSLIIAVVAAVKLHVKKQEETDLLLRRQRRLDRLEDLGYSSDDFEQLMAERRISFPSSLQKQKGRKIRRKKSFFR